VTHEPITTKPTKQSTQRRQHDSQTHHRSTSKTNYQPQPKIKNRTAHPCIPIRRAAAGGMATRHESILKAPSDQPEVILEGAVLC
jgi:hypothetical protein